LEVLIGHLAFLLQKLWPRPIKQTWVKNKTFKQNLGIKNKGFYPNFDFLAMTFEPGMLES